MKTILFTAQNNRRVLPMRQWRQILLLLISTLFSITLVSKRQMDSIPNPRQDLLILFAGAPFTRSFLLPRPPSMTIESFLDAAEPTLHYFPDPLTQEYPMQYKRKAFALGLDLSDLGLRNMFTCTPGQQGERNPKTRETVCELCGDVKNPESSHFRT